MSIAEADRSAVEAPRYSLREGARMLQLPAEVQMLLPPSVRRLRPDDAAGVRVWSGEPFGTCVAAQAALRREAEAWRSEPNRGPVLSFRDLATWFVQGEAAALLVERLFAGEPRGFDEEGWEAALRGMEDPAWKSALFASDAVERVERLLQPLSAVLGAAGAAEAQVRIEAKRSCIDVVGDTPIRLQFAGLAGGPRSDVVYIDPRRRFGWPIVASTATSTEILSSRFLAGDSIHAIADDYLLRPDAVEEAVRYEAGCAAAAERRRTEEAA